jgi:hypothetical protein
MNLRNERSARLVARLTHFLVRINILTRDEFHQIREDLSHRLLNGDDK